jgi:3'-5' exoribonuclease 1
LRLVSNYTHAFAVLSITDTMGDRESRDLQRCLERSPNKKEKGGSGARSKEEWRQPRDETEPTQGNNNTTRRHIDYSKEDSESQSSSHTNASEQSTSSPAHNNPQLMSHEDVYSNISNLNGQINRMDLSSMKKRCRELNLHPMGKREAVKRRLKEFYKEKLLVEAGLVDPRENRNVDYFVVIDFEATCEERNPPDYKHEVIEFPAVLVCSNTGQIVDIFHEYCRPVINPTLSEFCNSLTSIEQSTVDAADVFDNVHRRFVEWMFIKHELGMRNTYSILTDGPFDMGRFLFLQCQHSGIEFPHYGNCWVNIRKSFANYYKSE